MTLDVFCAAIWTDELGRNRVVDEDSALALFAKHGSPKRLVADGRSSARGMTMWREPLRVVALVRGVDQEGDPCVYLIHEVGDGDGAGGCG